ncbi:hypothetical protein BASA62_002922, partial [Batrachochytrium salamandrivorans]
MFDSSLWVLPHFVTHYAGQTTQGDTNEGDGVDQASGSKDATNLPLRVYPLSLKRPLQESNTPNQSGASSSVDPKPKKVCTGGHVIQQIFKPCPQQKSPPELQPSTLYDPPQSDEMPLPAYVGKSEAESHRQNQNTEQYREFIEKEAEYFKSEYSLKKKLGQGKFGMIFLATRNADGMEVAYKSIAKSDEYEYAAESSPPSRCHSPSPLVFSDEQSVEQCMLPRPPNLLIPYEFALQMYLSRPGHENPYVPKVFDYIILEDRYIVVMEYIGEDWVTLAKYVEGKGQLDIEDARIIIKKVVNGMIYLKQYGILHEDIH